MSTRDVSSDRGVVYLADRDLPERVVTASGAVIEISDESQRLFATMLMKLTEMAVEMGRDHGNEGMAALHGAMKYLSSTKMPANIAERSAELCAWAESCGLEAM